MSGALGRHVFSGAISKGAKIDTIKQRFALTKHHRCQRQMNLVDMACADILPHGLDAAAALRARCNSASMPSVMKWKVVPPSILIDARGWCVSTKVGA